MKATLPTLESVKRFSKKNVDAVLDLFDEDAIIYEPFSAAGVVNGRTEIKSFLKVACNFTNFVIDMKSVRILTTENAPNFSTAIVNLRKWADAIFALDFSFSEPTGERNPKIQKLRIPADLLAFKIPRQADRFGIVV